MRAHRLRMHSPTEQNPKRRHVRNQDLKAQEKHKHERFPDNVTQHGDEQSQCREVPTRLHEMYPQEDQGEGVRPEMNRVM